MEKLTLKEIAGYTSNNLEVKYKEGMHYGESEIIGFDSEGVKIKGINLWVLYQNIKPILYPLEILTTNDEKFDLYLDLCDELEMVRCDSLLKALQDKKYYALDIQKYSILEEWMYKNHFDWKFDLIKRGLAIDKSTLNSKEKQT